MTKTYPRTITKMKINTFSRKANRDVKLNEEPSSILEELEFIISSPDPVVILRKNELTDWIEQGAVVSEILSRVPIELEKRKVG
jgi:hypothetical protein